MSTPSPQAISQVQSPYRPPHAFGKVYTRRLVTTPSTPIVEPQKTPPSPSLTTISQHGIFKPKRQFNLNSITTSTPVPRSHIQALQNPNWIAAMQDEINVMHSTGAWK